MSATVRHVGIGVGLIIGGALRAADFGPGMTESDYELEVYSAVIREVADWMESRPKDEVARVASNLTFRLEQPDG